MNKIKFGTLSKGNLEKAPKPTETVKELTL
jgi:hypothetical protein